MKDLHEEVNKNEESFLRWIEEDWNEFQPEMHQEWPVKHWDQLKERISPAVAEEPAGNVFQLQWWVRLAAMFLMLVSVWFVIKTQNDSTQIDEVSGPKLITRVNETDNAETVLLKDGTRVTLTAHSALSYYENFNNQYRVVHLDGEAYFETDQENIRPFIVISDNITSICRGNEFSISAYKDSDEINVTLADGQIEISQNDRLNSESNKVAVKSCQRYSFNKNSQQYLIGKVSDCEYDEKVRSMRKNATETVVML